MRRTLLSLAAIGLVFTMGAASGGILQLEAPGGIEYERDGAIVASGLPGKPVVAVLDEYEIRGDSLRYDGRRRVAAITGDVLLRHRRAEGARVIEAGAMVFSLADEIAQAEGGVRVEEGDFVLEAQTVKADLKEGSYAATGRPARARSAGNLFAAGAIRYDRASNRLTAENNVVWEMADSEEGKRVLTASRCEYDRNQGTAEAVKVEIAAGEFLIRGERLLYQEAADRFTLMEETCVRQGERELAAPLLSWEPARGLFIASGGASFRDGSYSGTAEELRYEAGLERVMLLGGARLARGRDVLTGAEILYNLKEGSLRVSGGAKASIALEEG